MFQNIKRIDNLECHPRDYLSEPKQRREMFIFWRMRYKDVLNGMYRGGVRGYIIVY